MLCTYLLLFNCQGSIALNFFFRRKLCYYITSLPLCQYLFEKFFKKFFQTFLITFPDRQGCVLYIKPCFTQLDYYSTIIPICQHIFWKFFTFVALHYLTNFNALKWLLCTKSLQKIQVFTNQSPWKPAYYFISPLMRVTIDLTFPCLTSCGKVTAYL